MGLAGRRVVGRVVKLQAAPGAEAVALAGFQRLRAAGAKSHGALAVGVSGLLQRQFATCIDVD